METTNRDYRLRIIFSSSQVMKPYKHSERFTSKCPSQSRLNIAREEVETFLGA